MAWGQYRYFLLLSFALILLTGVSAGGEADGHGDNGQWTSINNLINPHVHQLGEFAVKEYNKQARENLRFHSIDVGEIQWQQSGTEYRFVLNVVDPFVKVKFTRTYIARVWENLVEGARVLKEFKPMNG